MARQLIVRLFAQAFLAEAEGNPVCRRLQLKDIIPTAMQRLTKYPLLLESLAKYTQPRSEEMTLVRRCLERSREILNKVNQAIKEAENYNRLVDIQRRLDKSAFEKSDHAIANELKVLSLLLFSMEQPAYPKTTAIAMCLESMLSHFNLFTRVSWYFRTLS